MSCCPPGSWPSLVPEPEYKEKGIEEDIGDGMKIYRVGSGPKCIIWNYHILGFRDGRQVQLVDNFADKGYLVLIPDYFRGRGHNPMAPGAAEFIKETTQWAKLKQDWEERVLPYARKHGAETFGIMGTCWGTYLTLKLSSYSDLVKVGVSFHPAHSNMVQMLGESEEELLKGAKGVPQMFLPAGQDSPNVKEGGLGRRILGAGEDDLTIAEYPEMRHGWTVRGDIADPKVARDVVDAVEKGFKFLDKHMNKS